ncbi:MAG: hypothetical protein AAF637_15790 [Pseudomonadota bacterium]
MAVLPVVVVLGLVGGPARAQDEAARALPDLVGSWTGKAEFMLPEGLTEQDHRFVFSEQQGAFLKGEHSWSIPSENLKSHDGREAVYESTEPMLGVIGHDGTIVVVEHGDHTQFRMRLINRYTLDFVAAEGGDHPVVGHGVLVRE